MPPSSSTSSSPVIIPLSSSARDSSSSSFSKSARNTGNNINSTTKRQRQTALVRTMALGGVLVALFSWEVFSGVKMTSFKAEIGMIEESLLLLNTSIFSISEKLSFQQPKDDTIAASAPPPLQINTSSSMEEGRNVSSNNNNVTKPQSQQPQGGGGTAEDYRLLNHRSPILDLLCSECRASMTSLRGGTLACGHLINNQIQKLNKNHNNTTESSEEEDALLLLCSAVNRVLKLAPPEECARCRFDACNTTVSSEKEYWRPDDAAPRILMAKTLQLSTIPGEHRVPPSLLSNLTTFFSNKNNVYPARTYYFEYNPSIIQIPKSQIPTSVLTTQQEMDQVKYLASFRVTNMQQCISGNDELAMIGGQWPRPPSQDYLGLALLRSDLSVIANVVLDNKNTPATGAGGGGGQAPPPSSSLSSMEDYRLFVLQDQIYVASFHEIVPLWLVPPKTPTLDHNNTIRVVPNLFPSKLTIMARSFSSCPNIRMGSKNINYIWDHDRNETIVEDVPMGRKMTIDLTKKCSINQYHPNKNLENTDAGKNLEVADQSNIPYRSFGSVDELHFAKHGVFRNVLTGERGSACCVRITDPRSSTSTSSSNVNDTSHDANNGGRKQQKELWLGISHSKFKFRTKETRYSLPGNVSANHFFSTFYAFDTHEPFAVQAISGRFCLGFPTLNETTTTTTSTTTGTSASDKDKNPYGRHNTNALRLGADYFDCPAIHFVSGMVEKADDPSRIIIAYGVNDCAPRFVEVEKTEIQQLLFSKRQS